MKDKTILMITNPIKSIKTDINKELGAPTDYDVNKKAGKLKEAEEIKLPSKKKFGKITKPVLIDKLSNDSFTPIRALSPFTSDWAIKA